MNFLNTEIMQELLPGYGSAGSHTTYLLVWVLGWFLQDLQFHMCKAGVEFTATSQLLCDLIPLRAVSPRDALWKHHRNTQSFVYVEYLNETVRETLSVSSLNVKKKVYYPTANTHLAIGSTVENLSEYSEYRSVTEQVVCYPNLQRTTSW